MTLDHIGKYFYPQYSILQILGRIAFPLFAFQLTIGYQKTSNKKRYIKRLLIFGVISQPIYYLLTRSWELNILFSLTLGFWALWAWENKKYLYFYLIVPLSFFVDYQWYGIAMILGFYIFSKALYQIPYFTFNTLLYIYLVPNSWIQIHSIFALVFIYKINFCKVKLPKYFFYVFYPGHLLIIYLIKNFLCG